MHQTLYEQETRQVFLQEALRLVAMELLILPLMIQDQFAHHQILQRHHLETILPLETVPHPEVVMADLTRLEVHLQALEAEEQAEEVLVEAIEVVYNL